MTDEKTGVPSSEPAWNDRLEEAVLEIGKAAQGYKLMHIHQAQKASNTHSYLMGGGIVVGPLSSVVSAVGVALNTADHPAILVLVIVLGFLSGILVATVKFGKYDEVSHANKAVAARYTSIESNVRRQLGLFRKDRVPANSYMEWLETKYEELLMSAPLLPANAYDKYAKTAASRNLTVPERYDHVIGINEVYEEAKAREVVDTSEIELTGRSRVAAPEPETRGEKKIKRTNTMAKIPQLNQYNDKMLQYEMKRMMGLR